MSASSNRRTLHLPLRITLLACCILLSGCEAMPIKGIFKTTGEVLSQYPSTVLIDVRDVDTTQKTATYTFNWENFIIGDDKLLDHVGKVRYWRLKMISLNSQLPLAGIVYYTGTAKSGVRCDDNELDDFMTVNERCVTVKNLPLDFLMRADLDLIIKGTVAEPKEVDGISINVLFHQLSDKEMVSMKK